MMKPLLFSRALSATMQVWTFLRAILAGAGAVLFLSAFTPMFGVGHDDQGTLTVMFLVGAAAGILALVVRGANSPGRAEKSAGH